MGTPIIISADAVYDDGTVVLSLGIPSSTLARARRDGTLRFTRKGKRVFYLGSWLMAWLATSGTNETGEESGR